MQVMWWSTLSDQYEEEMKQQADIFAGPYGEQALKDFRCEINSPCTQASFVGIVKAGGRSGGQIDIVGDEWYIHTMCGH